MRGYNIPSKEKYEINSFQEIKIMYEKEKGRYSSLRHEKQGNWQAWLCPSESLKDFKLKKWSLIIWVMELEIC